MDFPRIYLVRQKFPDRSLKDVRGEVLARLEAARFASRLAPGSPVAIGVGSRGIANLAVIVRAAVDYWKSAGMKPFLFPAMGSHGAATAEGQARVLAQYGVTEAAMGCPVRSSLEVVPLGRTPEGIDAFMDRTAFEAGGVMLIGRVKWHTDFAGRIESGLFKMMAIGLGKFAGAKHYHIHAYRMGLENVIRSVGRQVLSSGRILGGLAILEDAHHATAQVTAVPVEEMERREEELLELVKSWMGRIPVDQLDILIVDEMGKNISGAGMDTKIINRGVMGEYNPWPGAPRIERIFVRDLTDLSYGNAVGFGMADVTTDRLAAKIDWSATTLNALTSNTLPCIRTPVHFASDRECLEQVWTTAGRFSKSELTIGWIRNTLDLGVLALSETLEQAVKASPTLEILDGPMALPFDENGNLPRTLKNRLES
jgi:hypothetical protein